MDKWIRLIFAITCLFPFIWFIVFIIMIIGGIMHSGTIPHYGIHDDPYSSGLDSLSSIHVIAYMLGGFSVIICLPIIMFKSDHEQINRVFIYLFFIGLSGFLIFNFCFNSIFLWVFD